jgi:hypothetical protein
MVQLVSIVFVLVCAYFGAKKIGGVKGYVICGVIAALCILAIIARGMAGLG